MIAAFKFDDEVAPVRRGQAHRVIVASVPELTNRISRKTKSV